MIQWGVHAGDEGGETPLEVSWWGPEDNHALLLYYHRDGVYLHRQNRVALQAWAQDLLEASNIRIDFTLRVEFKSSASYDMTCHPPKADKESKYELSEANITGDTSAPSLATVVYGGEQQKEFKTFLVKQLTDLAEGLINPAVVQESDRERALQKKKEVNSGGLHDEACGRGNGTVKCGSDSASRNGASGAAAVTGPSGHADALRSSTKRARTDDVQPPQHPVGGQWEPTDIVNMLPQCPANRVCCPLATSVLDSM
ncbi:TPA: hypothetical protein ACH3X1_013837 [Trebouxia sp. C0004]